MLPPDTQAHGTLAALAADLRANPLTRHLFLEVSRFRAIVDLDGTVVDANEYSSRQPVVPRDEYIGGPLWEAPAFAGQPEWEARWRSRFAEAHRSTVTRAYDDEFEIPEHPAPILVHTEISTILNDDTEPLGYMVEVTDVEVVRETERRLREQERLRELVFEQSFQLTAILDPDGTVRDVNEAAARIGLPAAVMVGKRLQDLAQLEPVNAAQRSVEWQRRIDAMADMDEPFTVFDVLPNLDGTLRLAVDCSMTPVRDERGDLELILLEMRDQTERYRTEERLRTSEERFRAMAETLPQMVWAGNAVDGVTYFSARWAEFTGIAIEDLLGQGFWHLVHPADVPAVEAAGAIPRDSATPVVFRMRRADGDYRWMESRMETIPDDDHGGARWFGGTLDITDRREAEDDARKREAQLRATLELTGFGTYVWDVRRDCFSQDSQLDEILGIDMQEMRRGNAFELFMGMVHPQEREAVSAAVLAAVVPGGPDYDAEFRMLVPTDDGIEEKWVAAMGRVEFDAAGEPVRLVGVFSDTTRRRHEDEARLRLQKIEAMGTLASGIAHDFNNVIGAILSYARVAEAELAAGESPATSIAEIARGALRAGDIVQRMLTFSREEEPRRVSFDLGDVVREARALVKPTLGSSIALDETIAADLPRMHGDPTQLHQVVVNLLTNASQAIGDARGSITIGLEAVEVSGRLTSLTNDLRPGSYLRLRVTDDGPGMTDAVARRIFDPFFTTKGPTQGTGLGLAAVQSIVGNHGGAVSVESLPGQGATFTAYLPVQPASVENEPVSVPASPVGEAEPTFTRVMFVDDEEALVRLAHRALPYRECVVTGFTDPVEAITTFERDPAAFDAVVTDLSMPGMTGLQLADRVRRLRPDIAIVLTSGYMGSAEHVDAEKRGVDRVVPKPCSIDDLADAIQELLAG
jgi:PAS domain S-box-containing protein